VIYFDILGVYTKTSWMRLFGIQIMKILSEKYFISSSSTGIIFEYDDSDFISLKPGVF
jgi:hypothetical protein